MNVLKKFLCVGMLLSSQVIFGSLGQCCCCLAGSGVLGFIGLARAVRYQQARESYEYAYMNVFCNQLQRDLAAQAKACDEKKRKVAPPPSYVSAPGGPKNSNLAQNAQGKKEN